MPRLAWKFPEDLSYLARMRCTNFHVAEIGVLHRRAATAWRGSGCRLFVAIPDLNLRAVADLCCSDPARIGFLHQGGFDAIAPIYCAWVDTRVALRSGLVSVRQRRQDVRYRQRRHA